MYLFNVEEGFISKCNHYCIVVDKLKNAASNLVFGVIGTNFVFCSYVTAKRPFDGNYSLKEIL